MHHARMKLPDRKLDYQRFVQEGAVGPIALGDPMEEVVAKVGAPGDMRSMHSGRARVHQYDNGVREYRHGRLVSITLRLHGEAGVSFDNGLDSDTTMEQAMPVIEQDADRRPRSSPHGTASFNVDGNIVSAYFMREGQFFPESEEEARTAPLTKIAVQHRAPEIEDGETPASQAVLDEAEGDVDAVREGESTAMDDGEVEFSPVKEVILPIAGGTKGFLTFDGERHTSLPAGRQALSVGYKPESADAAGDGLFMEFHDVHTTPVRRDKGIKLWRERTAEEHASRAEMAPLGDVPFERYGIYPIDPDNLPLTIDMTYRGLLQVTEIREGDPEGVKIRYKLLRPRTGDDQPSGSPRKNDNVEAEQRSRGTKTTA